MLLLHNYTVNNKLMEWTETEQIKIKCSSSAQRALKTGYYQGEADRGTFVPLFGVRKDGHTVFLPEGGTISLAFVNMYSNVPQTTIMTH